MAPQYDRVVNPAELTGKPVSSAELRGDAFRAWRLGSDDERNNHDN